MIYLCPLSQISLYSLLFIYQTFYLGKKKHNLGIRTEKHEIERLAEEGNEREEELRKVEEEEEEEE